MEENNQYGKAMTKTLSTGVIKKQKTCSDLRKLNLLIESISHKDEIGQLFIVDIKLNEEKAIEKNLLFNEINPPIFEKEIFLDSIAEIILIIVLLRCYQMNSMKFPS